MKYRRILIFLMSALMTLALSTPVHAQSHYRFLALGNSLTIYQPEENIWFNTCGMAASTPDKDWVHRVTAQLSKKHRQVTTDVRSIKWEYKPELLAEEENEVKSLCENNPYNLVVIQNSDNISNEKLLNQYEGNLRSYVNVVKTYNPHAKIILINDFKSDFGFRDMAVADQCDQIIDRVAKDMGCKVADLSKIGGNRDYTANIGAVVYGSDGQPHAVSSYNVANHPSDKGMEYIAYQVLKQIGIHLPVGHDFDDLKGIQKNKDGWHKIKGQMYYYSHGQPLKGFNDINNAFYYLDRKTGALKKDIIKTKNAIYYTNADGIVQFYTKNKNYYNQFNVKMDDKTGAEQIAEFLADRQYSLLVKKKTSKAQALKKSYQWFLKRKMTKNILNPKTANYPAVMAISLFTRNAYKNSIPYAFAYLANRIGYRNVSVAAYKDRYFVVIGKKVFDIRNRQYNVPYKDYMETLTEPQDSKNKKKQTKEPQDPKNKKKQTEKQKDPKIKKKQIKVTKINISAKKSPAVKITGKAKRLVAWDAKNKKLYYNNGAVATGIVVFKHQFYAFNKLGVYDEKKTKKLRAATVYMHDAKDILRAVGYPLARSQAASCFGNGDDITYIYKKFKITTFRSNDGKEVYISCIDNR